MMLVITQHYSIYYISLLCYYASIAKYVSMIKNNMINYHCPLIHKKVHNKTVVPDHDIDIYFIIVNNI